MRDDNEKNNSKRDMYNFNEAKRVSNNNDLR